MRSGFVKYVTSDGEYAPKHPAYAIQYLTYVAYMRGRHGTCDIRGIRDRQTQYAECADCVLEVSTCGGRSGVCQAVTCPSPSSCGGAGRMECPDVFCEGGRHGGSEGADRSGSEEGPAEQGLPPPPSLPPSLSSLPPRPPSRSNISHTAYVRGGHVTCDNRREGEMER